MANGEFDLIRRFREMLPELPDDLVVGPGDDCAAFRAGDGKLRLLTCDALVEGRHFRPGQISPELLGRRLAAVNLSDVAAMGGIPRFALMSMVLPDGFMQEDSERLVQGAVAELGKFGASIAGGNLSGGDFLVADMTLVGEVSEQEVVLRSGAVPGDRILVTGHPGSSAAGRALLEAGQGEAGFGTLVQAHQAPVARVEAGRAIASSGLATAMIDVSDGLLADLGHLCEASGVGAWLEAEAFDFGDDIRSVAEVADVDPLRWVLAGGEDYELLFTVPPELAATLREMVQVAGVRATVIGTVTEPDQGVRCLGRNGQDCSPGTAGWDHFRERGS